MTIADWLRIAAVLIGPIVAVQLTRYLDNKREVHARKLDIFKTLMSTRGLSLAPMHVEALNRIDLEFSAKKRDERQVLEAWKAYLDLLSDKSIPPEQWGVRRVDLFVELLHKMATVLDFQFDKTHIKNSSYSPVLYGDIEAFQAEMRTALREMMAGKRFIPIWVANFPPQPIGNEVAAPTPNEG